MTASAQPFEPSEPLSACPWKAGEEPIPGYALIAPLGKGGFGEVWKCQAPGGFHKAIKFVSCAATPDGDTGLASQELQALEFIKNIRHPFILTVERVEVVDETLLIVMELADRNLADLVNEYQSRGEVGIPRGELLGYLAEAAEALDLMNFQHGLQHLDVKPQNLFLVANHVKVADFGLVNRLPKQAAKDSPIGQAPRGVTPRYVAPEILQHRISRRSDQYSLAIVYQELLTGEPPFKGRNGRQLFMQHMQALPDVAVLPAQDRPLITRALAKEPEERFQSCHDLIRALVVAGEKGAASSPTESGSAEAAPSRPKGMVSLQGFSYQKMVGRSPLGEFWQVQAPTGEEKIAYHLQGFALDDPAQQAKALGYLQSLRHPALLRFDIAEMTPHRIVLVLDPWGPSLAEQCREGAITPDGILKTLAEAAHVLEELGPASNLYHLGLNPDTIVQGLDGVQLRDFGLIPLLWQAAERPLDHLNTRYAAPELAKGRPGPASDQYSLALVYADGRSKRLAGPTRGGGGKQRSSTIDLTNIPAPERKVLTQALDGEPGKRFASAVAMVERLADAHGGDAPQTTTTVRNVMSATQGGFLKTLAEWIDREAARSKIHPADTQLLFMDDGTMLHSCIVEVVSATAFLRLDLFKQEWNARTIAKQEKEKRFFVDTPRGFWQRVFGKQVGVEVGVALEPLGPELRNLSEATFMVRPVNCGSALTKQLRQEVAPAMVATLRQCLNALPDRRGDERYVFTDKIHIRHRASGAPPAEEVCQALNLSKQGIGFLSPILLDMCEVRVLLNLPADEEQPIPIFLKAQVGRCKSLPNGKFEVGAQFSLEGTRKENGAGEEAG